MSADGLTSSRMCQILKAILSNDFFFPSKFYDNFSNFTVAFHFLFNINFLFSCRSSLLLLQGRGQFPNCCQHSSVSAGLQTPHLKGLSAKFSIAVKKAHNVIQSSFQHDALFIFYFLICMLPPHP